MKKEDYERLETLELVERAYNSSDEEAYMKEAVEGVPPGKQPMPNPKIFRNGTVEQVGMEELKEMEDEREAKRELKRMQSEAEKRVKRRIVREHF